MTSVLDVVWQAAGYTDPDRPVDQHGVCALCGKTGKGCLTRKVVSDSFVDWDRLRYRDQTDMLCRACSWALRTKSMRWYPTLIRGGNVAFAPNPSHIRHLLDAPLGRKGALLLPISRKKHVTLDARWGYVSHDHGATRWTDSDVGRLAIYETLRSYGFGETALQDTAPRWQALRKLADADQGYVLSIWPKLDPWRDKPWQLEIAARATRKDPEQ